MSDTGIEVTSSIANDNRILMGEGIMAVPPDPADISPSQYIARSIKQQYQFAIESRVKAFESLDPSVVAQLSIPAMETALHGGETMDECAEALDSLYAGNRHNLVTDLSLIVAHPDAVRHTLLHAQMLDTSGLVRSFGEWRDAALEGYAQEMANASDSMLDPDGITDFIRHTLPPSDAPLSETNGQIRMDAINTGLRSAHTLLILTKDDPELRKKAFQAIRSGIAAREKYWFMGDRWGVDDVSQIYIDMVRKFDPVESVRMAMEMGHDKLVQDAFIVASRLYGGRNGLQSEISHAYIIGALDDMKKHTIAVDPEETKRSLGMWVGDSRVIRPMLHRFVADDRLYGETIRANNGVIEYFGERFNLRDVPEGECVMQNISFGQLAVENGDGELMGFYNILEGDFGHQNIRDIPFTTVHLQLSYAAETPTELDMSEIQAYWRDYGELLSRIGSYLDSTDGVREIPLASQFQFWKFMRTATPEQAEQAEHFIGQYGLQGLFTFVLEEHEPESMYAVLKYATSVEERTYEEQYFFETLLSAYARLMQESGENAGYMTRIPEDAVKVHDILMARSRALFYSAIKRGAMGAIPPVEREAYENAFVCEHLFQAAISDPSGEIAQSYDLDFEGVSSIFQYHSPDDPDSFSLFQSAFDLFMELKGEKQKGQPYFASHPEMRKAFYQEYVKFERDMTKVTPDPVIEHARIIGDIAHDLETGDLPAEATAEHPVTICFVGIGEARAEEPVIQYFRDHTKGYQFVGVDVYLPAHIPEGVEFAKMSVEDLGDAYPSRFNRIYILASPLMDEYVLAKWQKIAGSLSQALVPEGELILDQALRYGRHSYEAAARAYKRAHRDEPEGMFYRSWTYHDTETGTRKTIGNRFFEGGPVYLTGIFGEYGLKCTNMPRNPMDLMRQLNGISADEHVILEHQLDMHAQAWYQSHSLEPHDSPEYKHNRWNRAMYIWRKSGQPSRTVLVGRGGGRGRW